MDTTPFWYIVLADVVKVTGVGVAWWWTWKQYWEAKEKDREVRYAEAMRPFRELREKRYLEVVHVTAVLSSADTGLYPKEEIAAAKRRFCELYVAELSMVESEQLESTMVKFAEQFVPELVSFTPAQKEAFKLAHKLRDEFLASSGLSREEAHFSDSPKKNSPVLKTNSKTTGEAGSTKSG
jgi:hypothetical protein